ncbi:MAG: GNAT family N-acetyltransferase [Alphaproteobacteria bacterium]|nr:GNAT family N-acetyltransferase [Alphaproteobacteria bacterium]
MLSEYSFRKSIDDDKNQLAELFVSAFGFMAEKGGALQPIKDRYWVALFKEHIVAVTGILPIEKSDYNGYEVTWTCTAVDHRKKGLIVHMLKMAEQELPDDHIPLYCDCWRIRDNKTINMVSVMKHMGMIEILRERIKRKFPHSNICSSCPLKSEQCYCFGDLYQKTR